MKERKKPSQSWIERSKYEIENADRLLAERQEQLKEIREKKTRKNSMKMYIARDLIGVGGNLPLLTLSEKKPVLRPERVQGVFFIDGFYVQLPEHYYPEVTFENSPQEVELKLIEK